MNRYIRIIDGNICFVIDGINEILNTDIAISNENYNKYSVENNKGKQFRIKDVNGVSFEDIFEEITLDDITSTPDISDRVSALEDAFLSLL